MEVTSSEIEPRVIPDEKQEALMRRLVEAELLFEILDDLRVEALRAAIARRTRVEISGSCVWAIGLAAAAIEPVGRRYVGAGELRNRLFDRTARSELDHQKGDQHDSENCGNDQEQASNDISEHSGLGGKDFVQTARLRTSGQSARERHHVSGIPRPYRGFSLGRANTSQ